MDKYPLIFKALNSEAPSYTSNLIGLNVPNKAFCSHTLGLLLGPRISKSKMGGSK